MIICNFASLSHEVIMIHFLLIMKISEVIIAGIPVELTPIDRQELKGVNVDTIVRFSFFRGLFNKQQFCFAAMNRPVAITPMNYRRYAERVANVMGMPVVFILDSTTYVNRSRMIEQGVYFVVSKKYAFLPTLLVNAIEKSRKPKKNQLLSPVGQFLLLYYLQSSLGPNCTIKDFESACSYSYQSIGRGLLDLEQFGLCQSEIASDKEKRIIFSLPKQELWEKAMKFMRSPVRWIYYTDDDLQDDLIVSSINALSHYSRLNPEEMKTVAILDKDFKKMVADGLMTDDMEGKHCIEVWIYNPRMFPDAKFVDKLSLYLSLQHDTDARVEKELDYIIEKIQW